MQILAKQLGKRFNREWVFRKLEYNFQSGESYAIIGSNGSGKSTLLQVLGGITNPSEGSIEYFNGAVVTEPEKMYSHITIAAPYTELIEEMTAKEFLRFHFEFKHAVIHVNDILAKVQLAQAADKQIRNFSSGMKQRIKLAQAIFSSGEIVLLDEPCTNLDEEGIKLYQSLIQNYCKEKLIIVSSNDVQEYAFCRHQIHIQQYK